ncbi:hypothetical protein ABI59_17015 [Acidobacteria bacterium Mor1]|nr:hypothetical protein ABI59_17015 [Acidobacteria bacterium Mor1]
MLSWLVIGAGIHGVRIAHSLLVESRVPRESLRLVDPGPEPLARWRHCTENARIRYLRSPSVHHLGVRSHALEEFARENRVPQAFLGGFNRPSRQVFDTHTRHLVEELGLRELHVRAMAQRIERIEGGWRVETDGGSIESRRIVLAIGRTGLAVPPVFQGVMCRNDRVRHLYGDDPIDEAFLGEGSVVIVGLGLGAAECALGLSKSHRGPVTLLARHDLRRAALDVRPGWEDLRKTKRRLHRAPEPSARRSLIDRSRKPGSIPPRTADELLARARGDQLQLRHGTVEAAEILEDGAVQLRLGDGSIERTDRVVLATGFKRSRPGGRLVDDLVAERELPTAPCGYPWLGEDLQWDKGLFVTGALAELALGPQAPNIIGAAMAARRI